MQKSSIPQPILQSMKDAYSSTISFIEKDIAALSIHITSAYEKAEKGTQQGEFYFGVLNDLRTERRKLKAALSKYVATQKYIKKELAKY